MKESKLQDFVIYAVAKNRITFGDVRRLQRDCLPDGISSYEDVKTLLDLDAKIERTDRAWTAWLVSAVFEFAVQSEQCPETDASGTGEWLLNLLSETGAPTKARRRITRAIRRKARRVREMTSSGRTDHDDVPQAITPAGVESAAWPLAA
ncbi:MAG: hypothetical protein J2P54_21575 [Bradyrhizobiaceae bacterium]|nr:hypothetical protein [Bradyrhizobiaceae bacterium]